MNMANIIRKHEETKGCGYCSVTSQWSNKNCIQMYKYIPAAMCLSVTACVDG